MLLKDLLSMDREEQAMVKGFIAGIRFSDTDNKSGKDPPEVSRAKYSVG